MEAETPMVEPTTPGRGLRQRGDGGGSQNTVVLGPRDGLNGTLKVNGEIRVQGTVEGELHATGDVHVEGSANVKAAIDARNVTVRGTVTGDVTAKEKLFLAGSGALIGNVKVVRLSIENGATLNGNVTMSGAGRETRHENKTEENKEGG
jgi:cytoskeletal protein CcmA (bactofilin family)